MRSNKLSPIRTSVLFLWLLSKNFELLQLILNIFSVFLLGKKSRWWWFIIIHNILPSTTNFSIKLQTRWIWVYTFNNVAPYGDLESWNPNIEENMLTYIIIDMVKESHKPQDIVMLAKSWFRNITKSHVQVTV